MAMRRTLTVGIALRRLVRNGILHGMDSSLLLLLRWTCSVETMWNKGRGRKWGRKGRNEGRYACIMNKRDM